MNAIFQPFIVGVLTPNRNLLEWRIVFIISCSLLVFTNGIYLIWASAETQPWYEPHLMQKQTEAEEEK